MPFPYELYPKAKETHCLNLPEISVSRPPFPGSIRTADGCFWGERDNNSYVSIHQTDQVCAEDNSKCFNQSEVFVDRTVPGVSDTCGQICYAACECNTSNGWYPTCQGTDCYKVVDTRYAGKPNAASASRSLSDVASISASGANSGISASAAAKSGLKTASAAGNYTATAASAGLKTASAVAAATGATSGISTLASGATTCYKKKTCSEGGYYDSVPADQKCSSKSYNGYSCYTGCSYKTCSDYGYNSSIPSGKTCTAVYPRSGLTCYKDCKDDYFTLKHQMTISWVYLRWEITDSAGKIIGSGSKLANQKEGYKVNETYKVPSGTYEVKYTILGWVPCDEHGKPMNYCVCSSSDDLGGMAHGIETISFTVNSNTQVPFRLPYCGHGGCKGLKTCSGGSTGFQPVDPDQGLVEPELP